MTITENDLRHIRQRAIFNGTVPRADIIALVDTIRDPRADLTTHTPAPSSPTEPPLCDWSTEPQSNNPDDLARVCITHEGHH